MLVTPAAIRDSASWKHVLMIILQIGNYINDGTKRGKHTHTHQIDIYICFVVPTIIPCVTFEICDYKLEVGYECRGAQAIDIYPPQFLSVLPQIWSAWMPIPPTRLELNYFSFIIIVFTGCAAGFRLSSLQKLGGLKTSDNKTNLLHYVAQCVAKDPLASNVRLLWINCYGHIIT